MQKIVMISMLITFILWLLFCLLHIKSCQDKSFEDIVGYFIGVGILVFVPIFWIISIFGLMIFGF